MTTISLSFPLDVVDDWPPVTVESLPFTKDGRGYVALKAPLFVKDLSVGDVIAAETDDSTNTVNSWQHVSRSGRTTVWLLRLEEPSGIASALEELRAIGCSTVGLDAVGAYSVDVPEEVTLAQVDNVLTSLDSDAVAIAYPSLRHEE